MEEIPTVTAKGYGNHTDPTGKFKFEFAGSGHADAFNFQVLRGSAKFLGTEDRPAGSLKVYTTTVQALEPVSEVEVAVQGRGFSHHYAVRFNN